MSGLSVRRGIGDAENGNTENGESNADSSCFGTCGRIIRSHTDRRASAIRVPLQLQLHSEQWQLRVCLGRHQRDEYGLHHGSGQGKVQGLLGLQLLELMGYRFALGLLLLELRI